MSWLRKYPGFAGTMLVLVLVLTAEGAALTRGWLAAHVARKQLEKVSREYRSLQTLHPAATEMNAALIEADGVQAAGTLAALRNEISADETVADRLKHTPAPTRRPDAFFDIATFVEAMRSRAQQAGVALLPDERFGFSAYANEAPALAQLAAVFRERLIVQYLVEALLEAKPHQLLAVQRQHPTESTVSTRRTSPGVGPSPTDRLPANAAKDYFDIDPRISLRVPGVVATTAFRLSFTGRTAALRNLLNKLGEFKLPLVVRAVEVAPAELPPATSASARAGTAPLVAPSWSRFVVTVEFVEFEYPGTAAS